MSEAASLDRARPQTAIDALFQLPMHPGKALIDGVEPDPDRLRTFATGLVLEIAQLQQLASEAGLVDVHVVLYGFPLGWVLERVRDVMTRRERRRPAAAGDTAIELAPMVV